MERRLNYDVKDISDRAKVGLWWAANPMIGGKLSYGILKDAHHNFGQLVTNSIGRHTIEQG